MQDKATVRLDLSEVGLKPVLTNLNRDNSYVLAVSGGVDSVSLLDLLVEAQLKPIVAHFDHQQRPDSKLDLVLVKELATKHQLDFYSKVGNLPKGANESLLRQARYQFLNQVKQDSRAEAIITAHHQDDLFETMVINLSRKTGRRGLTSLRSRPGLARPLLSIPKKKLIEYAKIKGLNWREDSTNADLKFLRNRIRAKLQSQLTDEQRQELSKIYDKLVKLNDRIDRDLKKWLTIVSYRRGGQVFSRDWFNKLPDEVAQEVVYCWLRQREVVNLNRQLINYLIERLKTLNSGKKLVVSKNQIIALTKRSIRFEF